MSEEPTPGRCKHEDHGDCQATVANSEVTRDDHFSVVASANMFMIYMYFIWSLLRGAKMWSPRGVDTTWSLLRGAIEQFLLRDNLFWSLLSVANLLLLRRA